MKVTRNRIKVNEKLNSLSKEDLCKYIWDSFDSLEELYRQIETIEYLFNDKVKKLKDIIGKTEIVKMNEK